MTEAPEAPPSKRLCLNGTNLLSLTEYDVKKHLSGSEHKRLTASDSTKQLKAFFSSSSSSPPTGTAVAESEQEKELDKDAGTFQKVMDQGEVANSKQGGRMAKLWTPNRTKTISVKNGLGRKLRRLSWT